MPMRPDMRAEMSVDVAEFALSVIVYSGEELVSELDRDPLLSQLLPGFGPCPTFLQGC